MTHSEPTDAQSGITLVFPATEVATPDGGNDRMGGETNSLGTIFKSLTTITVSPTRIQENLKNSLSQLQTVLADVSESTMKGWTLESITVSLAITAEGSIGVATAGAEASMEATFTRAASGVDSESV